MYNLLYSYYKILEFVIMHVKKTVFTLIILPLFFLSKLTFADFESGLKSYNSGDFKEALKIWTPLAEGGLSNAQYNVGLMHHNGQGTSQNFSEAFKWFLICLLYTSDSADE